mgnify:CR=1 FL=1
MHARPTTALFAASALALALPAQIHARDRDIYFGTTLVDPETETLTPDSYIVVDGTRITEIGTGRPVATDGANMHDLSGTFALPGLIDTHAHVTWGPVAIDMRDGAPVMVIEDRADIYAFNANALLAYGVTTVRNPAGDLDENQAYSAAVADGTLLGPEAYHAAPLVNRQPVKVDGPMVQPDGATSIGDIVHRQAAAGADFIKLYEGLSETDVAEGIAAAHANGLPAIGHLSDVSWTRAAELGIDALVHMMPISPDLLPAEARDAYLASRRPGSFAFFEWYEAADLQSEPVREMLATLAREQVYLDATLIAFEPAFHGNMPEVAERDAAFAHPDMVTNWRTLFRFDLGWMPEDYARAQQVWPKVLEMTRLAYEAGVPMTIGTDLANPWVAPGISMSREMALHREAGIPAWAVLRMATIEGARLLGIDERTGRIAPGHEADLLFVRANPLEDFAHLQQVSAVVTDGTLLDPAELRP